MFDLARIAQTGFIEQIDFHETLGSTNDRALEVGASGDWKLPLLVLAERQTAGRGRGSNSWLTTDGALTFSLVLEAPLEQLPPSQWPQVALVAGVAVAEALSRFVPASRLQLKWPNDIYLNGRKAGGILSESVPGWRDRLVVGIGVNVNNRLQGAAERGQGAGDQGKLSGIAVSLVEFDGIERNLTGVLAAILDEFERWWEVLLNAGFGSIAEAYRGRCLLTGKTVTIQQHEEEKICGVCRGLDPYGGLLLGTPHGEKAVISGTVVAWQE